MAIPYHAAWNQVQEESNDRVRLPKEPPLRLAESPTLTGAYTIVLRLEFYDRDTVSKVKIKDESRKWTHTHCAHIFDESTNTNISDQGGPKVQVPFLILNFYSLTILVKHQYGSSAWTIVHRFGYKDIPGELDGTGIHRLENVLTLNASVHSTSGSNRQ